MFVGYPESHSSDTYRMWDPRSQRVHITRDITWLNRMFFKKVQVDAELNAQVEWMPKYNPNQPSDSNSHKEVISDDDEESPSPGNVNFEERLPQPAEDPVPHPEP